MMGSVLARDRVGRGALRPSLQIPLARQRETDQGRSWNGFTIVLFVPFGPLIALVHAPRAEVLLPREYYGCGLDVSLASLPITTYAEHSMQRKRFFSNGSGITHLVAVG